MMGIKAKKGLELPFIPGQIGPRIHRNAQTVLKEHPEELEQVYNLIRFIFETQRRESLLALEEAIIKLDDFDAPLCDFLPNYIIALVDATESALLAEMMSNDFEIRKPDDFEAFVLYLYILTILVVQIRSRSEHILYREQALIAWSRIKNECLSYLSEECMSVFQLDF